MKSANDANLREDTSSRALDSPTHNVGTNRRPESGYMQMRPAFDKHVHVLCINTVCPKEDADLRQNGSSFAQAAS